MPTYDYVCRACGKEFELFQQMSDPVKRKCPTCGKLRLERLIGLGAGVLFKGSGFYETDYRSDSYRKKAESESKPAEGKTEAASGHGCGGSCACSGGGGAEKPATPAKPKPEKKSGGRKKT